MSMDPPPRSRMKPERLAELFEAVRALLLDVGYERLTFDAVAVRARTSKATLYRHWKGNKADLVMAALTQHRPALPDHAGAASLDEVFAQMAGADGMPTGDLRMGLMLLHAAAADPDFGAALRKEIIAPLVNALAAVFETAADRGEIVRDSPLFRRLAHVILTDLAFSPLISGGEENAASRQELFRTIIRPALTFTDRRDE
ncbi:TetR/AcrR family transcriptional regulator [Herbidospora galbida]|uniref:TetR/AcrR family transcriptional regulator n=1 Tax=Herbidospora galbida TaxID=2575442 RepID=A0A4U3MAT0_9ACTN|nr:TetR/AcrR family transcriptional regulator [Herbidospora galbida]TKK85214.1 TetR/AcrR family transcriptional regulator [Herbidospora galbida]